MNPALSVVFFTTLSGAGLGMLAWLGVHYARAPLRVEPGVALVLFAVALALLATGLLSSMLHLGKPLRAWRAFSQWRSSWLSREGIASVATFVPALFLAGCIRDEAFGPGSQAAAIALVALALLSIVCTAKIYDTLKPVAAWNNRYVLPGYLLIGLGTGALWLTALLALAGRTPRTMQLLSIGVLFALVAIHKLLYWRFVDRTPPAASAESLTGLGRIGTVTSFEAPHTEANYLLREMGFVVARKHARVLRGIALAALSIVPLLAVLVLMLAPGTTTAVAWLALASATVGSFVERWLFFAEATHCVVAYYGDRGR